VPATGAGWAVDLSTFHKVQDRKDTPPIFPVSENLTVHEINSITPPRN